MNISSYLAKLHIRNDGHSCVGDLILGLFTVAPEIAAHRSLSALAEGKRLSLICLVTSGTPPISFAWTKDGVPIGHLQDAGLKLVSFDDFQNQLQIDSLSIGHNGNYTCNAKNVYGSDQMTVRVVIKSSPKWFVFDERQQQVIQGVSGERVEIDCRANGHPQPIVKMIKGI